VNSPLPTPTPVTARTGTPPRPPVGKSYPSPQAKTYSALAQQASEEEEEEAGELEYSESHRSEPDVILQRTDTVVYTAAEAEGPFIASMHELKKHASRRRSRNSILMQERFRTSSSRELNSSIISSTVVEETSSGDNENTIPNGDSPHRPATASPKEVPSSTQSSQSTAPEHIVIAIRLLRAHKSHVDQIMETLKLEMDTLRDFDRLLEEPGRPSEEELINYYESVDLCLEQRQMAGVELRNEMNRISAGDSE
jgi:hypothetical protein